MSQRIARRRTAYAATAGLVTVALLIAPVPATAEDSATDRLYVTNGALDQNYPHPNAARFTIDSAGTISPAGTAPAGLSARGMVFTTQPDAYGRRFAYAASSDEQVSETDFGVIDRYQVAANGALTHLGTTPTPEPFGIAISPDGRTVYVANFNIGEDQGAVSAFRVTPGGDLALRNTVPSGVPHAKGAALTPDGRYLYVSHGAPMDTAPASIIGFPIAPDGTIGQPITSQPVGATGHRVVITPDGRFAYVTSQDRTGGRDVFGFRIGPDGTLTPVSDTGFEAGTWVEGAAVSPDSKRLYVTQLDELGSSKRDGKIVSFTISSDGQLSGPASTSFGFDPIDLAFGLDGKHLYVSDFAEHMVAVFNVDTVGALKRVQTVGSQGKNPGFQSVSVQPR